MIMDHTSMKFTVNVKNLQEGRKFLKLVLVFHLAA